MTLGLWGRVGEGAARENVAAVHYRTTPIPSPSPQGGGEQAVLAARKERGHADWFSLRSPATVERVREACLVESGDLSLKPS